MGQSGKSRGARPVVPQCAYRHSDRLVGAEVVGGRRRGGGSEVALSLLTTHVDQSSTSPDSLSKTSTIPSLPPNCPSNLSFPHILPTSLQLMKMEMRDEARTQPLEPSPNGSELTSSLSYSPPASPPSPSTSSTLSRIPFSPSPAPSRPLPSSPSLALVERGPNQHSQPCTATPSSPSSHPTLPLPRRFDAFPPSCEHSKVDQTWRRRSGAST
jgi:hypothetical protein